MRKMIPMIALVLIASVPAVAQMHEGHDHATMAGDEMKMDCSEMMDMHDEMKQKMQSMDARLMELVEEMNTAKGVEKTEKMAAVINELVEQRHVMHQGMMKMQPMMMRHMMGHMQKGMSEGMSDCPMMKMNGETSHEKHH